MGSDMFNEEQLADAKVRADAAKRDSAKSAAEREIADAHRLLSNFGVQEQIPPFKTPIAPLSVRLRRLNAMRDQEAYQSARAEQRHGHDVGVLQAEINSLLWEVARLTVALRPLAALAPAYAELGLDGAAIVAVQVPDSESPRNVQLLPAHAFAAAAALSFSRVPAPEEPSNV